MRETDQIEPLKRLMEQRYSCRAFQPRPVPEARIRQIVETAGRAASWCNAQPWQVVVTQGDETNRFRSALLETVASQKPAPDLDWPAEYPGAYGARRRTCGYQLYEAVGIARDDHAARGTQSMRNFALFDAPHVAIIHAEAALGPYGAMDTGGFVAGFMLAATALGVASIAQASVAAYPDMIRDHFALDNTRHILCAVSFGYADDSHPANSFRTDRAGLGDILDLRG